MKIIDTEKFNEVINEIICENPVITYPEQDAYDDGYNDGLNRALSEIEDLAVEIICCKDCKYRAKGLPYCAYFSETDYCSKGERKETK